MMYNKPPQGGILSPLLFSLFINSITSILSCQYQLFADDLQLHIHTSIDCFDDTVAMLNNHLLRISVWAKIFGINVNPSKCQAIIIGRSRQLSKSQQSI